MSHRTAGIRTVGIRTLVSFALLTPSHCWHSHCWLRTGVVRTSVFRTLVVQAAPNKNAPNSFVEHDTESSFFDRKSLRRRLSKIDMWGEEKKEICSISSRSRVLAHRPCPKLEMFCPSVLQLFYGCSKVLMTNHGMCFLFLFLCFSNRLEIRAQLP